MAYFFLALAKRGIGIHRTLSIQLLQDINYFSALQELIGRKILGGLGRREWFHPGAKKGLMIKEWAGGTGLIAGEEGVYRGVRGFKFRGSLADKTIVGRKFDCPGGRTFMPSVDAAISMLSKSMDNQKLIVQLLTNTAVALQNNAPAKEVLQKVEEATEEQSATLGTVIDQTI
jgi:hypothetical protein